MKHSKSFDKYEPEQLKDLSRRAGIASGKARRKKRRRLDKEKMQQRARQEIIHEEVMALRRAARALKAASDAEQLR